MSELLERMRARITSDIRRGIPFHVGMEHLFQYVDESLNEMDRKLIDFREIEKNILAVKK